MEDKGQCVMLFGDWNFVVLVIGIDIVGNIVVEEGQNVVDFQFVIFVVIQCYY